MRHNKALFTLLVALAGCGSTPRKGPARPPTATMPTSRPGSGAATRPAGGVASAETCARYHRTALHLLLRDGDPDKLQALLQRMVAVVTRLRARGEPAAKCEQDTAKLLRATAGKWATSKEAGAGDGRVLGRLETIYRIFVATFPRDPKAYVFSFYRAQVLYKLKRWAEAGRAYDRVRSTSPPRGPGGKQQRDFGLEAAHAAVLAWQQATALGQSPRRPVGRSAKPVALTAAERRYVAAIDALTRLLGRVPRRAEMLYIKARLLYGRNHFSRAVGLFAQVIKEHPRHSAARGSALLLLDALNRQGQHQQLARWTKRLLANKALAKGTLLAQLRALRVQIAHRAAQKLFQAKRFAECGKAFAAASRLPGAQRTCELLFNAAVCFERAKKLRKSLALRRSLVQKRSCRSLAAQAVEQGCRHPARLRDRWWRKRCKARR